VMRKMVIALAFVVAGCSGGGAVTAEEAPATSRQLQWPKAFHACKNAAVDIYILSPTSNPRVFGAIVGAGVIINKQGYVLTNSHVAECGGQRLVGLYGGEKLPYRVVARNDPLDLAVIKIVSGRTFTPVKIGRSSGLKNGDLVFAIGNPEAEGHSVTIGKVTSTAANWGYQWGEGGTWYHNMIATDTAIGPGYSGGPLINGRGELVGLSCGTMTGGSQSTGFAIPVDTIIERLSEVLDVQDPRGFVLGMTVAGLGPAAVTKVVEGSPAGAAGLKAGDVITAINGKPVTVGCDFYLALLDRNGGDVLKLTFGRGKKTNETALTLGRIPLRPAEKIAGLVNGVDFEYYEGRWQKLPDFDKLEPAKTGVAATIDAKPYAGRDRFALRFKGYVRVPKDGRYVFYTASDDGSRLWIGGKLVVDNDGLPGPVGRKGYISLEAGLHPITVTFFELSGGDSLWVSYEGPGLQTQWIPKSALFRKP